MFAENATCFHIGGIPVTTVLNGNKEWRKREILINTNYYEFGNLVEVIDSSCI